MQDFNSVSATNEPTMLTRGITGPVRFEARNASAMAASYTTNLMIDCLKPLLVMGSFCLIAALTPSMKSNATSAKAVSRVDLTGANMAPIATSNRKRCVFMAAMAIYSLERITVVERNLTVTEVELDSPVPFLIGR